MKFPLTLTLQATIAAAWGQTICIDPGHISDQASGTRGHRVSEVHANWLIGAQLKTRLEALGYTVVMTKRTEREVVSNRRRAEIANKADAALMVRLHCDASSGSGFAVYVPTRRGTAPDGHTGPSASVLSRSQTLGHRFDTAFVASLNGKLKNQGFKSDLATAIGGKQGALTGSIYAEVPVLLVEMVVLTNRHDEDFLLSSAGETALVDGFVKGIEAAVPLRRR